MKIFSFINRRNFLKFLGLFSITSLVSPLKFIFGNENDSSANNIKYDGNIIIIGAGAAGLYAGKVLKSKGIQFQILEASDRYGGRLGQLNGFASYAIDLGAQWLHGKNNIVGKLIQKFKTNISLDNNKPKYWFKNKLRISLPKNIEIFSGDLPDLSYQDFSKLKGLNEDYKYIIESIAGDKGASASRLSVYYDNLEFENWNSGDENYKFQETYFSLIEEQIASHVKDKIKLNTIISKIDYSKSKIVITDTKENMYIADKLILTVPITILKAGDIEFVPKLPKEKIKAFSKIGMDAGMKVFLRFSKTFFDKNIIGGKISAAYFDDSVGKLNSDSILMAFIMGEQAEKLSSLSSHSEITNALLRELDEMYDNKASKYFIKSHIEDWTVNPFIRGAYSYSTVGMGNARKIAAQSIQNRIFFAGEAMNTNGHHQTVHGAMETGYRAVRNIIDTLKK